MQLRPYQERAISELRAAVRAGSRAPLLVLPTGGGKCLAPETPVLRFDGTIVRADEVRTGDLLMGPDSTPRTVLATTRGFGPMFRIEPIKGDAWSCNDVHVLTLVHTETNKVVDVPLDKYLRWSKSAKHCHKQFSVGVEFQPQPPLPMDPYFLGLWFADGSKGVSVHGLRQVAVSKPDVEVLECVNDTAEEYGLRVRTQMRVVGSGSCPTHYITRGRRQVPNNLLIALRSVVGRDATVPRAYLTASRADRMQFLAGWVDGDGYLGKGFYEVTAKRKDYADAVAFVARSLGFKVNQRPKFVNGQEYQRLNIVGNIREIPTRIERKRAGERLAKRDASRTGFSVVPLNDGEYVGWELDGDGRFLLGDFTVTHNTVIATAIVSSHVATPGRRVLFVVHRKELLDQAARTMRAAGLTVRTVRASSTDGPADAQVTVAMVQTLAGKRWRDRLPTATLVVFDECFPAGTMIATPSGDVPIESIRVHDTVLAWCHDSGRIVERRVAATFERESHNIVTVHTSAGSVTCTANHPFYTARGYVAAGDLRHGEAVAVLRVRHDVRSASQEQPGETVLLQDVPGELSEVTETEDDVCGVWRGIRYRLPRPTGASTERGADVFSRMRGCEAKADLVGDDGADQSSTRLCAHDGSEPDACGVRQAEDGGNVESDQSQTARAWRERDGVDGSAANACRCAWMANGARGPHRVPQGERNPVRVQARPGTSGDDDGGGDRRVESLVDVATSGGRKEGHGVDVAWVEGVEVHERGGFGPTRVYNFEVEGTHNYFANGFLVHNCHHLRAESWEEIASHYVAAILLGLTATPQRSDGKPMGKKFGGVFDSLVVGSTISELTELGNLVPCVVYGPPSRGKHLAADPVDIYVEHGRGRQCVIFCTNVVHAQDVASRLLQRGVQAVCVDGKLDAQERAARLARFHRRDAAVVTNVAVLTEGWDEPAVELCILARGAEHCGLYLQMVGRVLRPYPGKTSAELWDLRGVTHEHGMPDDERAYSLEGDAITLSSKLPPVQQCRFCGAVYRPTPICPQCGKPSPMPEPPEVRAQRLALLAANDSPDRRDEYWQRLQAISAERGYNPGWASHRYRAKYGVWRAA